MGWERAEDGGDFQLIRREDVSAKCSERTVPSAHGKQSQFEGTKSFPPLNEESEPDDGRQV